MRAIGAPGFAVVCKKLPRAWLAKKGRSETREPANSRSRQEILALLEKAQPKAPL
jgi:hypothetical protein